MKFEDIKVGDRVRRAHGGHHGNYRIGDIGVVVELQPIPGSGRVKLDRDQGSYVHDPDNLELVEAAPDITVEQALAFLKSKGEVQFTPKWERLQVSLNNSHLAYVYEHHVEVGCQKFTFDRVEALYAAVQKARNHGK